MSTRFTKYRNKRKQKEAGDKPFLYNKYSSSDSEGSSSADEPHSFPKKLQLDNLKQGMIKNNLFFHYWHKAFIRMHIF